MPPQPMSSQRWSRRCCPSPNSPMPGPIPSPRPVSRHNPASSPHPNRPAQGPPCPPPRRKRLSSLSSLRPSLRQTHPISQIRIRHRRSRLPQTPSACSPRQSLRRNRTKVRHQRRMTRSADRPPPTPTALRTPTPPPARSPFRLQPLRLSRKTRLRSCRCQTARHPAKTTPGRTGPHRRIMRDVAGSSRSAATTGHPRRRPCFRAILANPTGTAHPPAQRSQRRAIPPTPRHRLRLPAPRRPNRSRLRFCRWPHCNRVQHGRTRRHRSRPGLIRFRRRRRAISAAPRQIFSSGRKWRTARLCPCLVPTSAVPCQTGMPCRRNLAWPPMSRCPVPDRHGKPAPGSALPRQPQQPPRPGSRHLRLPRQPNRQASHPETPQT